MKSRLNVVVLAFLAVIGVLVWIIVKDRGMVAPPVAAVASVDKGSNTVTIRVQAEPPTVAAAPSPASAVVQKPQAGPTSAPASPMSQSPVAPAPAIVATDVPHEHVAVRDHPPTGDGPAVKSNYTAQPGDTVSNLAAELPGGDKKVNREAVINANPSLQRDPDLVIAGKTYQLPTTNATAATAVPAAAIVHPPVVETLPDEVVHELKYIARAGDTVSTLAAALLGSDTKENRDAIIGANTSLRTDPDRLIAGQTYRIPVRASQPLASAPASALPQAARPTTQPDADSVLRVSSPRELRYVAKPGDTVSTLAAALLGSDTKENRDAITNNNKSLKQDPDHVEAGKSYWIPAPMPQ